MGHGAFFFFVWFFAFEEVEKKLQFSQDPDLANSA